MRWACGRCCCSRRWAAMMVCSSPGWVLAAIQVSGVRAAAMSAGKGRMVGVWYLRLGVMVMCTAGTPRTR